MRWAFRMSLNMTLKNFSLQAVPKPVFKTQLFLKGETKPTKLHSFGTTMDTTFIAGLILFGIGFYFGAREAEKGLSWQEYKNLFQLVTHKIKKSVGKAQ